jgi:hypothetical protein
VGLTLAAVGAEVLLTELSIASPLLNFNLESNFPRVMSEGNSPPRCAELEWGQPLPYRCKEFMNDRPLNVVVGADIVYDEALFAPLLQTIDEVCTSSTILYLCRLKRGTDIYKIQRFYDGLTNLGFVVHDCAPSSSVDVDFYSRYRELTGQGTLFELIRATRAVA